jgi:3-hydroxyacyl-[acyl-carrier-protein] dehydratase
MLLNDFYRLLHFSCSGNEIAATISIDPGHEIFRGHFPGQPVVPGVCMIQILKELLEKALGKKLLLTQSAQVKFLHLLVPEQEGELYFSISREAVKEGGYSVHAVLSNKDTVAFKFLGIFKPGLFL